MNKNFQENINSDEEKLFRLVFVKVFFFGIILHFSDRNCSRSSAVATPLVQNEAF